MTSLHPSHATPQGGARARTSATNPTRAAADGPATRQTGRRVTDAPTRMFHWLFALSFVGAYLTAESEHFRLLHVTLGYLLGGLLVFRLAYGVLGPRPMALGTLWRKASGVGDWVRSLWQRPPGSAIPWRQGQNLTMAIAILLMLATVLPLTLSGYAVYNEWGDWLGGEWLEELHELLGNAFLLVVLVHLGFLLALSILRRKSQALPMLTGRLEGPGPDLVKSNRLWLAALMLAAAALWLVWQWQQSPSGLF